MVFYFFLCSDLFTLINSRFFLMYLLKISHRFLIMLIYFIANKSLLNLRQLYFLMKDGIFKKNWHGFTSNSEMLENILKDYLDPNIKMSDVSHPK